MSLNIFQFHLLLDEVAARPKNSDMFLSCFNIYDFSFMNRTELDLYFNFLVSLLNNFNFLVLERNDIINVKLNFTSICLTSLHIPGYFFKNSSYFNLFSSYCYLAPLKGFFD